MRMNGGSTILKKVFVFIFLFSSVSLVISTSSCTVISFNDYVFTSDTMIVSNSWTFSLDVKASNWSTPDDGIVISYHFYEMNSSDPVNYISPIDILFGSGIVAANPGRFNFTFSWGDRYVNVTFISSPGEIDLVMSNLGNVHCIARTNDTFEKIISVENGDKIKLSGYLVDVSGTNGTRFIDWKTDTVFGNEQCEILVVSDVVPIIPFIFDPLPLVLLLIIIVVSIIAVLYAMQIYCRNPSRSQNRVCKIIEHDIS